MWGKLVYGKNNVPNRGLSLGTPLVGMMWNDPRMINGWFLALRIPHYWHSWKVWGPLFHGSWELPSRFSSILQWTFNDRCGKPRCKALVLSIYNILALIWLEVSSIVGFQTYMVWWRMMIQGLEKPPPTPWFPLDVLSLRQWGLWRGAYRWEPLGTWEPWGLHQNWWYLGVR